MQASHSITLHNIPASAEALIRAQIDQLSKDHNWISGCQVTAEVPAPFTEGMYKIHIDCTIPNGSVVIDRAPMMDCYQEDLQVAIWSAFAQARQKIKAHVINSANFSRKLQHA
jgi:DNA-binding protein YbaB